MSPSTSPRFHFVARLVTVITVATCLSYSVALNFSAVQSKTVPNSAMSDKPQVLSVSGEILVRFRAESAVAKTRLRALKVSDRAGEIRMQLEPLNTGTELVPGLRVARVKAEEQDRAITALRSRTDVFYAEPNYVWQLKSTTPNDPRFSEQWGLSIPTNVDQAWDITTGDSNVVVAVIDGGIDVNHQDLRENIYHNPAEIAGNGVDDDGNGFIDDVEGWDFVHNDNRVFDDEPGDDHATHVAGIIGARGNNGLGVTGVCWRVSLLPVKALGPNGGSISNIIAAYGYVKSLKERGVNIRVINNSYGGPSRSLAAEDAIANLNQAGILFVVAAGNDRRDNRRFPTYPANYNLPNVVAVAATDRVFGIDPFYSNYGKPNVMLAAPGTGILSTTPHDTYGYLSGTSMAAPFVAGAAALVVSARPDVSLATLKGALIYSRAQPQGLEAEGLLDVFAAIQAAKENDTTAPAAPANLQYQPPTFGGRTVELQWTAPGDDGTTGQVVDYEVTSITPSGQRFPIPMRFSPQPAGATQNLINILIPLGNYAGTLELKAFDNVGNSSVATVSAPLPISPNTDPYVVSLSANSALSSGGQRLPLDGDDQYYLYNLPFNVPMGDNFSFLSISTNGVIHCTSNPPRRNGINDDLPSSIEYLTGQPMIAGLWEDLTVDQSKRADAGVYLVTPDNDTFIFRWQANKLANGNAVNFEIEIKRNLTITVRYGSGNNDIDPVVGLSYRGPQAYVVPSHTHEYWQAGARISLNQAQTVTFTPRPQPAPAAFQFEHATYQLNESAGVATIAITRQATTPNGFPILGDYSVNYSTISGTALPNSDYIEVSGTLTFTVGEASKTFTVPIVNDSVIEADESLTVMLSNPTNGAVLGPRSSASIIITDNDSSPQLITDASNHVIALDSVTFVRDPFSVVGSHNLSADRRSRIMIFTSNLGLTQPTSDLSVTASGIPLAVEAVGDLAGVPNVSYIIVKLDPVLSGNVSLSIAFRGVTSNVGTLTISP